MGLPSLTFYSRPSPTSLKIYHWSSITTNRKAWGSALPSGCAVSGLLEKVVLGCKDSGGLAHSHST